MDFDNCQLMNIFYHFGMSRDSLNSLGIMYNLGYFDLFGLFYVCAKSVNVVGIGIEYRRALAT